MVMNPPSELKGAFAPRPVDASKRTVGTVTVVGGSGHYIHAPVIAGLGARAAGAGLVQLVVPDASRIAAGALVPEATFTKLVSTCVPPKADVMVVGMGLGVGVNTDDDISRSVFQRDIPRGCLVFMLGSILIHLNVIKAVVGFTEFLHDFQRVIRRSVIHHNDLNILMRITLISEISQ